MKTLRQHDLPLHVVVALAFLASAVITVAWCWPTSAVPGMTMTMTWMRMADQTWLETGGTSLAMWSVMMVAMMLPVIAPELHRFRRSTHGGGVIPAMSFAAGYFSVWVAIGLVVLPLGFGFDALAMRSVMLAELAPLLGGLVVLAAGVLQFTSWKARALARCRYEPLPRNAWHGGARLGLRCFRCCAGLTAMLLVTGVMDLRVMAMVTIAISTERLTGSVKAARMAGVVILAFGMFLVGRALFP